ncbi:methylmalonyl Co-A mutase-associated GTPase MeaB [Christiangramia flava]|uniref:Putative periplasmic protein kinase ArgK and related GTPases of G3E family n=1 Tax=Christiangramia flava JLT2011 TaxID=1229726 RepID=A0A1L7I639_9FLAO|nr:methylmalonyl Co-A mutase-associated GTPase MeaB [Christiangramia flava]APU69068.1 putative periplasmic protein kinase ArgK and related GTPases of G3E family [Christiangramia flava JLT2011]OSS38331.1 putative periplasmic protein kinase ArgK [Christiangramia flava JLT2011]
MSEKPTKSALSESESKPGSASVNPESGRRIRNFRKNRFNEKAILDRLLKGNKTALGQAITLIESNQQAHQSKAEFLVEGALPYAQKSVRIGITGVPGVGKSTFIESFGNHLIEKGHKVAVLAVDPSSSVSHGSILGDKTRMEKLVTREHAFIRPSPSGDSLGGVARKTRESILLCEAAGFDVILIETVGVGQSETTVHSMTDFFLLLKLAGAGDELQGIKRGIIEMADGIVINKADGDNIKRARDAKLEFNRALHLYPEKESQWKPKVQLCSGLHGEGISEVWEMISEYHKKVQENGFFEKNRHEQNKFWLFQTINEYLKNRFYQNEQVKIALKEQLELIEQHKTTAFAAAKLLLNIR